MFKQRNAHCGIEPKRKAKRFFKSFTAVYSIELAAIFLRYLTVYTRNSSQLAVAGLLPNGARFHIK
jgi:hypothetical protein